MGIFLHVLKSVDGYGLEVLWRKKRRSFAAPDLI
jgi:hypothetical protein